MKPCTLILCVATLLSTGCRSTKSAAPAEPELIPITKTALYDSTSLFYGDFGHYPKSNAAPIGIFDSGTGGLTVMEAILTLDLFNNSTGQEGPDGICDFAQESFIYLADQANMPYGNYSSENKTDFLRELIIKDVLFLMGRRYYANHTAKEASYNKQPVKSIVIACNTATATGLDDVRALLQKSRTGVTALGVIQAGVKGALAQLSKDQSAAIGVMATVGTIKTEGYERAIRNMAADMGFTGTLQVVNQPAMGFAEAVDEEPDFVLRTARQPRANYRGPSLHHPDYPIDVSLLGAYNFDFSNNGMLYQGASGAYTQLQLNAAQNYARYHLLALVEKLRATPNPQPLKVVIMGCTHYPYHKETLRNMLHELRNYQRDGAFPYRELLAEEVVLVDPAQNTAKELYTMLREQNLLAPAGSVTPAGFYITVPNNDLPQVGIETPGRFTYEYKYGREPGTPLEYVKTVPFSTANIDIETQNRFRSFIPVTFSYIDFK